MIQLQLHEVEADGRRRFAASADGRPLGQVLASVDQRWLRAAFHDDGAQLGIAEFGWLVDALIALARSEGYEGLVLSAGSQLLLRNAARSSGLGGPLRGDLALDLRVSDGSGEQTGSLEDRFVAELNSLLPGITVRPAKRPAGVLRSVLRSASAGVTGIVHLTVRDDAAGKPLSVAVPLEDDVMAECVAIAIDAAWDIRRRFHPLVDGVRIFVDQSIHGLRSGMVAGLAEAAIRDIHLNSAFVLAREMETLERRRRERQSQSDEPGQPQRRPSMTVAPPFTRIDSVVAHEFWHQIEFGFESGRYRDSVEFRRAVGGYFGVETLEHVIKGANPGAPETWQVARARLAEEVSPYATTSPKEATAELFTQWWCTAAAPPPSAQFLGEVLRRFFPAADLVR